MENITALTEIKLALDLMAENLTKQTHAITHIVEPLSQVEEELRSEMSGILLAIADAHTSNIKLAILISEYIPELRAKEAF